MTRSCGMCLTGCSQATSLPGTFPSKPMLVPPRSLWPRFTDKHHEIYTFFGAMLILVCWSPNICHGLNPYFLFLAGQMPMYCILIINVFISMPVDSGIPILLVIEVYHWTSLGGDSPHFPCFQKRQPSTIIHHQRWNKNMKKHENNMKQTWTWWWMMVIDGSYIWNHG